MLKNAYLLAKIGADKAENEQGLTEFRDGPALLRLAALRLLGGAAARPEAPGRNPVAYPALELQPS